MTKEEEDEVHRLVQSVGVVQLSRVMFKGMDVSEMINVTKVSHPKIMG